MRSPKSRGDAGAICYGDVVIFSDGSLAVVWAPDRGNGQVVGFELDELGNLAVSGETPEIVIAGRDTVQRVVGHHDELPREIRSALAHFVA
jgi:hypothetical protein